MTRLSAALIAVAAVCSALPAAAQTAPAPTAPNTAPPAHHGSPPYRAALPFEGLKYEMDLAASRGSNIPAQPLERIDLANRVSTLIELGRCDEARGLAREAGETQMALRTRQMCRADRN